jgi:hypothetical protein
VVAAAAVLRSIPKLLKPNISNVSINDVIKWIRVQQITC